MQAYANIASIFFFLETSLISVIHYAEVPHSLTFLINFLDVTRSSKVFIYTVLFDLNQN